VYASDSAGEHFTAFKRHGKWALYTSLALKRGLRFTDT
jgi:hypothetical protein